MDARCYCSNRFWDRLYFGSCTDCSGRSESPGKGNGFTVGGAVYRDKAKPLVTGLEGITVKVLDDAKRTVASTRTAGLMGLWSVDDLPAGGYSVVFVGAGDGVPGWRHVIKITVNAEHGAVNQSIRLVCTADGPKLSPR